MEENRNIEMRAETPSFVYRDGMTANIEYVEWLSEVKARFRRSQIKASVRVNTSMLEFYWSVGRDLVASHQNGGQMPTAGKSHQVGGQLEMPEKFGKTISDYGRVERI